MVGFTLCDAHDDIKVLDRILELMEWVEGNDETVRDWAKWNLIKWKLNLLRKPKEFQTLFHVVINLITLASIIDLRLLFLRHSRIEEWSLLEQRSSCRI